MDDIRLINANVAKKKLEEAWMYAVDMYAACAAIDSTPTVEAYPVRKCRCEYCEGRAYTHEPFTVITQKMNQVDVVFNFCPNCGADLRRGVENG